MRVINKETHEQKKIEIMEKCFECYAEKGFNSVGIRGIAKACGLSSGSLYTYFDDFDDLIIQATEHCMSKVEDDFMAKAPKNAQDIMPFIDEVPYWTAKNHGKKYRLMYQIYTNPKYIQSGKRFFEGVNERYTEYAKLLETKVGIPHKILIAFIFILIRASVHYALFGDEFYLNSELFVLKQSILLFYEKNNKKKIS